MKAILVLEDGRSFEGEAFGLQGQAWGEVVFNTSLSGYQEVLTDPSYFGQIVVMTNPLIGNYGVNPSDEESDEIQVRGLVVRELSRTVSNYRSEKDLNLYLMEQGIIGITGIDTRALTRHIRESGSMMGILTTACESVKCTTEKAESLDPMKGTDLVSSVTCREPKEFNEGLWRFDESFGKPATGKDTFHVAALDLGIKKNILRHLVERGCRVTLFPAHTSAETILESKPDGFFLSNGPGDPEPVPNVRDTVNTLLGKLPIFGICLGHQIFCLSQGARTFKLKFGHRGINHPVMDVPAGKIVRITSQNHGFAVDADTLPDELELTHYSLNDGTVEGVRHKKHANAFSVQYHPEASPGPQDTTDHFDLFLRHIKEHRAKNERSLT